MYGSAIETRRREQWAEMLGRNVDVANWQRDPRITGGSRDGDAERNEWRARQALCEVDREAGEGGNNNNMDNKIQGKAGKAK